MKSLIKSEEKCWYKHEIGLTNPGLITSQHMNDKQVFQERPQNPLPLDQLKMIMKVMKDLCMKIEKIEENLETISS